MKMSFGAGMHGEEVAAHDEQPDARGRRLGAGPDAAATKAEPSHAVSRMRPSKKSAALRASSRRIDPARSQKSPEPPLDQAEAFRGSPVMRGSMRERNK